MYPRLIFYKKIRRRKAKGFVEATFPEDVMRALKMRAVQENKRFSKVGEDALRQYLEFPKEKVKKPKITLRLQIGISRPKEPE